MYNTLKEIDNDFKNLTENLLAGTVEYVNDDMTEFTSKNRHYPLVFAMPVEMDTVDGQTIFQILIRVMNIQYENMKLNDIWNETSIIVQEIITYFNERQDSDTRYFGVTASQFKTFNMGIDMAAGWQGTISFKLRNPIDYYSIRFK
jgi:hypothetical protein